MLQAQVSAVTPSTSADPGSSARNEIKKGAERTGVKTIQSRNCSRQDLWNRLLSKRFQASHIPNYSSGREYDDFDDFEVRADVFNRSEKPVDRDVSRARRPWRDYRLLHIGSCNVKDKKQVESIFGVLYGARESLQHMSSMIVERNIRSQHKEVEKKTCGVVR
ncbi:hypothetical protein ARMSODRAFT_1004375 [Armillaria solidipes]|uniref:Uncharacterized protein n=1 Tax=Armillaria solidipes TaxID=1076256 RepID=A0A2H3BSR0_9AGAR|nr:hypothetical protein ARMSODRAFT_1004375 [Armillaria solidipes]